MMTKLFEKIDMVCVLRWTGVILLVLVLLEAVLGSGRGAGIDDKIKLFMLILTKGMFPPLVLLGIAEGLARIGKQPS